MKNMHPDYPIKVPLHRKIILVFIIVITIPLIAFESFLVQSWTSLTRSMMIKQYEVNLTYMVEELQNDITSIESMNDYIYQDFSANLLFFDKMAQRESYAFARNDAYLMAYLDTVGGQILRKYKEDLTFSFFNMDGALIYQKSNRVKSTFPDYSYSFYDEPWFQEILAKGPKNSIFFTHKSFFAQTDEADYISFGQVIRHPMDLRPVGVGLITINNTLFDNVLKGQAEEDLVHVKITNAEHKLLYSSVPLQQFSGDSAQILLHSLQPYQWNIEASVSQAKLTSLFLKPLIGNNIIFIIVTFLVLNVFVAYILYRLRPLHILADKMSKAKKGNFKVRVISSSSDEIGMLVDIFNDMTSEIEQLFNKKEEEYKQKLQFQLKSLETQITPHFIYNMLDLIRYKALNRDPMKVSEMIVALSKILRYTLHRPGELVAFEQERLWLEDYLFLQKQLYEGQVDITLMFTDEIDSIKVNKLILQPIIENAFIHGFESNRLQYRLAIKGYVEADALLLEVDDDGKGFPESLNAVVTSDNVEDLKNYGIGLYVTAQRFLLYAQDSSLEITSRPNKGTRVVFKKKLYE